MLYDPPPIFCTVKTTTLFPISFMPSVYFRNWISKSWPIFEKVHCIPSSGVLFSLEYSMDEGDSRISPDSSDLSPTASAGCSAFNFSIDSKTHQSKLNTFLERNRSTECIPPHHESQWQSPSILLYCPCFWINKFQPIHRERSYLLQECYYCQQESPPAWTQEAYRPPCSEYSFCCPTRVPPRGGYLTQVPPWGVRVPPGGVPDPGTPPGGTWPGYPPGGSGYPPGGYLTRVPPRGGLGTPRGVPDPGTPGGGGLGTPPPGGGVGHPRGGVPDPGTPQGGYLTWVPPGGGTRTPLPPRVDRQTKWNYYLPVVLRTRAVNIIMGMGDGGIFPDSWDLSQTISAGCIAFKFSLDSKTHQSTLNTFIERNINWWDRCTLP